MGAVGDKASMAWAKVKGDKYTYDHMKNMTFRPEEERLSGGQYIPPGFEDYSSE